MKTVSREREMETNKYCFRYTKGLCTELCNYTNESRQSISLEIEKNRLDVRAHSIVSCMFATVKNVVRGDDDEDILFSTVNKVYVGAD